MPAHERSEIDRVQAVAGKHHERLARLAQEVGDRTGASGRAEQLGLVRPADVETEPAPVPERAAHGIGVVMQVDRHLAHSRRRQPREQVLEGGTVRHGNERLRDVVGDRREPGSEPGRHHEGPHVPWSQEAR